MRAVPVSRTRVTSQKSESSPGYCRISREGTADIVRHGLYLLANISPRTDRPTGTFCLFPSLDWLMSFLNLSVGLFICCSFLYPNPPYSLFLFLFIYLFIYLSVYLFISIYLFIYLSIHPSIHPSIIPSIQMGGGERKVPGGHPGVNK